MDVEHNEETAWRNLLGQHRTELTSLAHQEHVSFLNARGEARATDPKDKLNVTLAYERAFMHAETAHRLFQLADHLSLKVEFARGEFEGRKQASEDQEEPTPAAPSIGRYAYCDIVRGFEHDDEDQETPLLVELANPDDPELATLTRQIMRSAPAGTAYAYSYDDSDVPVLKTTHLIALASVSTASPDQAARLIEARQKWNTERGK
jgi:hypothetical protein